MKRTRASYRAAALKGWRTRRREARELRERALKGWRTRRQIALGIKKSKIHKEAIKRIGKARPKPKREEWAITYDYGEKSAKFTGELRFQAPAGLTQREALDYARSILSGKTPKGITVESFDLRGENRTDDLTEGEYAFAEDFPDKARKEKK